MQPARPSLRILSRLKKGALTLAEAEIAFYILPALMLLLTIGTIAQRWMGLYAAHKTFFSAFIIWAGPIPLPGGFTLLSLLALSLSLKFIFKSPWSRKKSGIILIHGGVLVLLIGGLLTALFAKETYMVLREGQQSAHSYDYIHRALDIYADETLLYQLGFNDRAAWHKAELPFTLALEESCDNCEIVKADTPFENGRGMAKAVELKPLKNAADPEENFTGAALLLSGISPDTDGRYLVFDGMPAPIEFRVNNINYALIFGKKQSALPFSFTLNHFEKDVYGGTDKARSYASDITLTEGDAKWPIRIEMNKPYRYMGYTFFQSSFIESEEGTASVLSVVENKGRLFPYIGTLLLMAGLMLHLFIKRKTRR